MEIIMKAITIGAPVRPGLTGGTLSLLGRWWAVAAERRRLAALDEARLCDLGLTREARDAEAARPFWDVDRAF
jgi:uncharacterized protein YjiS (DUF1127 family)